ncbi:MAG: alpha/beta fold hydrolase [Bacteroidota bacterium]
MAQQPPEQHYDQDSNQPTSLQRAFSARMRQRFIRGLWARVAYWVIGLSLLLGAGFWGYMYLSTMQGYYMYKTVWMNPTLPRMTVNEAELFVLPRGDSANPPVLVVHDGPGWDLHHMEALNALQDSFYLVYYDQRGTGISDRVTADQLTLQHHLDDLDSLSRHFGRQQPIRLVGQGWGALLIANYLTDYAHQHVHSAVLISPPPLLPKGNTYFDKADHGLAGWWTHLETHFIKKHIWIEGDTTAPEDQALLYYNQRHLPLMKDAPDSLLPMYRAGAKMRAAVDSVLWDEDGRYLYSIGSLAQLDSLPIMVLTSSDAKTAQITAEYPAEANLLKLPVEGQHYLLNRAPDEVRTAIRAFWKGLRKRSTAKEPKPPAQ